MSRIRIAAVLAAGLFAISCSKGTEPQTPVVTTVSVSPGAVTLNAIGATQQLTATVKDQNGAAMSGQTVTWTSSAGGTASVSGSGLVTAAANGSATITASVGSVSGTAAVTVAQTAASLAKTAGDAQTDTVGQQLPTALEVEVRDALGNAMPGVGVTFSITAGGGSLGTASATTGTSGRASSSWTLGTVAGAAQTVAAAITGGAIAPASFSATAQADAPDTIAKVSGDAQSGPASGMLTDSIVVRVVDQYGNATAGVPVTFAVTGGGGSLSPTMPGTGTDGQAASAWTLGATPGANSAEAQLTGVNGSPVVFGATASTLSITSITPDTLVEGGSATIHGTGFSTTAASDTVRVDGVVAIVTAAFADSLQITVPTYQCQPVRLVNVSVALGGGTTNTVTPPLIPAGRLNLAVGERMLLTDPAAFCLQFAAKTTGSEQFIIGVGAAAESPSAVMPTSITGVAGLSAAPPAGTPRWHAQAAGTDGGPRPALYEPWWRTQWLAEYRLRTWESRHLPSFTPAAMAVGPVRSPTAVPNVGDTIQFQIPTDFSNPCNVFDTLTTVVKVIGSAGIWVADTGNPTTNELTTADIQGYSDTFDVDIYAQDTLNFGAPSDIDANQRIFIVLSIDVNKNPLGVAGFVFSGDLAAPASCAQSNQGEIYYSHVPDPNNVAGTGARSRASILNQMPSLIAHEFTHDIQQSRRLILQSGTNMKAWEAEGQAMFAQELVGNAVLGNTSGQDYGATVVNSTQGSRWYQQAFTQLGQYYGWDGASSQAADAPELCSLFASRSTSTSCDPFAFYGAAYTFHRFVSDQYGGSYAGGISGLERDWVDKNVALNGRAGVEALLGTGFDSLFARWSAMLFGDGRVPGLAADLQLTSWDLFDIFNAFSAALRLTPVDDAFGAFAEAHSIRGGSTQYYRLTAAGAHGALAVRVRDQVDAQLGAGMKPVVWVLRSQ